MALPSWRHSLRLIRKTHPAAMLIHPDGYLAAWWVVARNGQLGWLSKPHSTMSEACCDALCTIRQEHGRAMPH